MIQPRRYTNNKYLYRSHRYKRRIEDSGDPALLHSSGYAKHELLFGARITAARYVSRPFLRVYRGAADGERVCEHILSNLSREPCMFGTAEQVVMEGERPGEGKLSGRVTFIRDDPGRQMIGSFRPLTADDW